jgi:EmrB/QacA subfamily drug resistance transporter
LCLTLKRLDRRWLPLTVVTIGSFMTLLDSTIINVALPSIIRDFDSTVARGQLVVTVYLLALAAVIPVSGFLGERVGMKRLYIAVLAAFTVSSVLCAAAWDMNSLIVFRVLQGMGGGMLQPLGMAIMFTVITPLERARFMVVLGLPILLGPIVGPTIGGFLVEYVSWRAIFLINVPIGIIDIVLACVLLKESTVRRDTKLDAKGLALALIAFPGILLGLSEASDSGWTSPFVLSLLGFGCLAMAAFVAVELKQRDPLLQLRLFAHPMFSIAVFMSFVTQLCFFGTQFLLPLFLQSAHGLGAAKTGLILFPSAVLDFIGINISGRAYNTFGPRPFAILGLAFLLVTALGLSRVTPGTNPVTIAAISSLRGLGMGLCMMPVTTMAFNTVPQDQMPRATALQNVLMRLFGSASTAILTTILVVSLTSHGAPPGSSITDGSLGVDLLTMAFRDAFLAMSVVAGLGIGAALFLRDDVLKELQRRQPAAAVAAESD